jgi:hypothetical protein
VHPLPANDPLQRNRTAVLTMNLEKPEWRPSVGCNRFPVARSSQLPPMPPGFYRESPVPARNQVHSSAWCHADRQPGREARMPCRAIAFAAVLRSVGERRCLLGSVKRRTESSCPVLTGFVIELRLS